jgi:hypothetical protein
MFNDDVTPADSAREGGIKGRSAGVLAVGKSGNDNFGFEARFTLSQNVSTLVFRVERKAELTT